MYAQLLLKTGLYDRAEDMFLKSLESDPNQYYCLMEYGNFLTKLGRNEEAELFFERAKNFHSMTNNNLS